MKLTFKVPANKYDVFADDAFEHSVGTNVQIKEFGECTILEAEVIEEGRSALITVQTLEETNHAHRGSRRGR